LQLNQAFSTLLALNGKNAYLPDRYVLNERMSNQYSDSLVN